MAEPKNKFFADLFGSGAGAGAAFLFFAAGIAGAAVCLIFRKVKYIREMI